MPAQWPTMLHWATALTTLTLTLVVVQQQQLVVGVVYSGTACGSVRVVRCVAESEASLRVRRTGLCHLPPPQLLLYQTHTYARRTTFLSNSVDLYTRLTGSSRTA